MPEARAGVIGLIAEIVRSTTDLAGAACQGRSDLFDAEHQTPTVYEAATELCRTCPVRAKCWEWSSRAKVSGIVASTTNRPHTYRPTGPEGDHIKTMATYPGSRHRRGHTATTDTNTNDDNRSA